MFLVTAASADNRVSGSKYAVNWAERETAWISACRGRHGVGEKDEVELGRLSQASHLDIMVEVDIGVGLRLRMQPRGNMMPGVVQKQPKRHRRLGGH